MFAAETLDFVDIATTVASHRPLVEMAAQAGVHVICQKPFASTMADARAMVAAVEAAHERDMTVVALTGARGGRLAQQLRDTDVHICVPRDVPARILEVQHLVLHCICDGVDAQLLGLPDAPIPEQENP